MLKWIQSNGRGLLLCVGMALPAWFIGRRIPLVGAPILAILFAMLYRLALPLSDDWQPGIRFCSKKILQLAVILLGFGMNFSEVLQRGRESLPIILATISASLLLAYFVSRFLRLEGKAAILVGVGSSICGGSAIAATAPVIDADESAIAQAMSTIFLFNVVAAVIFPTLGAALGLSNEGFGLFAGTAINDTSSVTAAATAWDLQQGSQTLQLATIVKLTRTLAIIPITVGLALYRTKKAEGAALKLQLSKIFPWFILLFLLAAILTSFLHLPGELTQRLNMGSKFGIVMAMAAIGLQTNPIHLLKSGGKTILLGLICWVGIAVVSLLVQRILGLW